MAIFKQVGNLAGEYWIGLQKEEGWWKWTDGSKLGYNQWEDGEPSNPDNFNAMLSHGLKFNKIL